VPGAEAHGAYTFCGLGALYLLGRPTAIDMERLLVRNALAVICVVVCSAQPSSSMQRLPRGELNRPALGGPSANAAGRRLPRPDQQARRQLLLVLDVRVVSHDRTAYRGAASYDCVQHGVCEQTRSADSDVFVVRSHRLVQSGILPTTSCLTAVRVNFT